MPYPWPVADANVEMEIALEIALQYLERTEQVNPFSETMQTCALTILASWKAGKKHRIRLANDAIKAIEKGRSSEPSSWSYPKYRKIELLAKEKEPPGTQDGSR